MNTIVILGSRGMLGYTLYSYFQHLNQYNTIGVTKNDFEVCVDSPEKLYHIIPEKCIVINAIGMIPQKYGLNALNPQDALQYFYVNGTFPHVLQEIIRQKQGLLIHITTDCIYNGHVKKFYPVGAPPTETNLYGLSKALGEPPEAMNIRTSIIGEEKFGKGKSLLEWFRQSPDSTIKGFTHHFWNGVCCLELAKIIHECLEKNIQWHGIEHVTSPKVVSKYELLNYIKEVYQVDKKIVPEKTKKIRKTLAVGKHIIVKKNIQEQIKEQRDFWENGK